MNRLADYAMQDSRSRGRVFPEEDHPYRSAFMRDRDRVVHSRAFRRLEYKTQVFVNHEGDHYRTRLTHSLEVSQISRTIAAAMRLNPELAETLALSHDLGHTPFGHTGEEVLSEMMADHGGFDHNLQSLRIIEHLEERYAAFRGLNLTYEVREGILKHSATWDKSKVADRTEYNLNEEPPLEVQFVDLADEIAYNTHDVDDGMESKILDLDDLLHQVDSFRHFFQKATEKFPHASRRDHFNESIRGVIDYFVSDLIETSEANLKSAGIRTIEDVRGCGRRLIQFSDEGWKWAQNLRGHLRANLYQHHRVAREMEMARRCVRDLFRAYQENLSLLPLRFRRRAEEEGKERMIADYLSGMTDRYAIREHRRLFVASGQA